MKIGNENQMQQHEDPEPFMMVLELAAQYGETAILEALAEIAERLMENQDDLQLRAAWLHMELLQLLDRYDLLFPKLEPVAEVNHRGPALVQ